MNFRILTYNIHRAIGLDRRFRLERIVSILRHHQADIVLLQEVDVGVPRSRRLDLGQELAEALDFPHYATGLNVRLRQGRYGNTTLSRFPIEQHRNIDLTVGTRKRRGCLHTTLALPEANRRLEVFNLHLGLSPQERVQQVGLLVRADAFANLDPAVPCIVGGDFNDWRTRLTPIFTEILGFECATDRRRGFQYPLLTYPSFSPTAGLDKLFCRGLLTVGLARCCRLRLSRVASDHLPVIAELSFDSAAGGTS